MINFTSSQYFNPNLLDRTCVQSKIKEFRFEYLASPWDKSNIKPEKVSNLRMGDIITDLKTGKDHFVCYNEDGIFKYREMGLMRSSSAESLDGKFGKAGEIKLSFNA
ncbi:MAG: hypothetical protein ACD_20C00411G0010 [uncultured bacterium]|nr:MAG: hypothetical protein ACD_20C00411G0010 [uncultured bacterium]